MGLHAPATLRHRGIGHDRDRAVFCSTGIAGAVVLLPGRRKQTMSRAASCAALAQTMSLVLQTASTPAGSSRMYLWRCHEMCKASQHHPTRTCNGAQSRGQSQGTACTACACATSCVGEAQVYRQPQHKARRREEEDKHCLDNMNKVLLSMWLADGDYTRDPDTVCEPEASDVSCWASVCVCVHTGVTWTGLLHAPDLLHATEPSAY